MFLPYKMFIHVSKMLAETTKKTFLSNYKGSFLKQATFIFVNFLVFFIYQNILFSGNFKSQVHCCSLNINKLDKKWNEIEILDFTLMMVRCLENDNSSVPNHARKIYFSQVKWDFSGINKLEMLEIDVGSYLNL